MNHLPTIEIPYWISRQFIQKHKELTFIYGDDLTGRAYLGQAAHCFGETNCYAIPTKRRMCMNERDAFFNDEGFELLWKPVIDIAISRIPRSSPIIPFPRIGQGDAQLPVRSPKTFRYLTEQINLLAYPAIQWINP